jgi:hypothetical protein
MVLQAEVSHELSKMYESPHYILINSERHLRGLAVENKWGEISDLRIATRDPLKSRSVWFRPTFLSC